MKLFISYSHDDDPDNKLCEQIKECLQGDFDIWFDKSGLLSGDIWWNRIREEIDQSDGFICLLSSNWLQSIYCQKEFDLAFLKVKNIFPILIDPIQEKYLPEGLPEKHYSSANKTKEGVFDYKTIAELMRAVAVLKGSRVFNPTILITPGGMEWCEIPEGKVIIDYGQRGQKLFKVSPFIMSKYPVTNSQYRTFMLNGYRYRAWWHYSEDAYQWRLDHPKPNDLAEEDCPYVNISWYDAIAFCRWLGHEFQNKFTFNLPTEMQWQRAAQGDDYCLYPWGNEFSSTKCNTIEGGIKELTFVTQYKDGISPFEVYDMVGNAWEWCLNDYRTPDFTDTHSKNPRTIKGGSWADNAEAAKVTNRQFRSPDYQSSTLGFRLTRSK